VRREPVGTMRVLDGNSTFQVMQQRGATHVPVRQVQLEDLSDKELRKRLQSTSGATDEERGKARAILHQRSNPEDRLFAKATDVTVAPGLGAGSKRKTWADVTNTTVAPGLGPRSSRRRTSRVRGTPVRSARRQQTEPASTNVADTNDAIGRLYAHSRLLGEAVGRRRVTTGSEFVRALARERMLREQVSEEVQTVSERLQEADRVYRYRHGWIPLSADVKPTEGGGQATVDTDLLHGAASVLESGLGDYGLKLAAELRKAAGNDSPAERTAADRRIQAKAAKMATPKIPRVNTSMTA